MHLPHSSLVVYEYQALAVVDQPVAASLHPPTPPSAPPGTAAGARGSNGRACLKADAIDLCRLSIVTVQALHVRNLQTAHKLGTPVDGEWHLMKPAGACMSALSLTLSFSCVSRTALPSGFLRQAWPSLRNRRTTERSYRKHAPPAKWTLLNISHVTWSS